MCQSEAELIRPWRGQFRPGEAPLTTGVRSWGKVPEHWYGHIVLPREGFLCAGEEAFPFQKPKAYVSGDSEGNTVGAQAG